MLEISSLKNSYIGHNNLQKQNITIDKPYKKKIVISSSVLLAAGVMALCLNRGKNVNKIINLIKGQTPTEQTLQAIKECKNLTFNTSYLNLIKNKYNNRNIYDLALRYAIIGKNTKLQTGRALLKNKTPEIFRGVEEKTLLEFLDKLPQNLHDCLVKSYPVRNGNIKFGEKVINWHYLGQGGNSVAYKLTDNVGNTVCFKHVRTALQIPGSGHGIIDEVAILNEANKAGVKDVPQLYMANIFGTKPLSQNQVEGAWQLVEFIDKNKVVQDGLKLEKWLTSKGLIHTDIDNPNNCIGNFVIDMGGICSKSNKTIDKNLIEENIFNAYV